MKSEVVPSKTSDQQPSASSSKPAGFRHARVQGKRGRCSYCNIGFKITLSLYMSRDYASDGRPYLSDRQNFKSQNFELLNLKLAIYYMRKILTLTRNDG